MDNIKLRNIENLDYIIKEDISAPKLKSIINRFDLFIGARTH